jgi:L,D-transpeptidase YcbB
MRHPCIELAWLARKTCRFHFSRRASVRVAVLAAILWIFLPIAATQAAWSPEERASIRSSIFELLSNEQGIPLPIKQRREALQAYYQELGGELLWLEGDRAAAFVSRLKGAERDGLDPNDYPSKQLSSLSAAWS